MDILEAINGRRAVREFTPEAVDAATIRGLIDAAICAPSAMNRQPWGFTVVRDRAVIAQISHEAKAHLTALASAQTEHARALLDDPAFDILYQAPVLLVISGVSDGAWIVEDCALAAENLMLAACAAGLGTCWIGFAHSYLNSPQGRRVLDLPAAWVQVAPIVLGHPKAVPAPVPRHEPTIRWIG